MRFDDMLATVLARAPDRASAIAVQWRQLLDLLAQRGADDGDPLAREAFDRLAELRDEVPVEARRDAAAAIAHAPMSAGLFGVLAGDVPTVSGPLIARAPLSQTQWLKVIPDLGPTGRGLARHRRDLPPAVTAALRAYGANDLLLTGTTSVTPDEPGHPADAIEPPSGDAFVQPASFEPEASEGHEAHWVDPVPFESQGEEPESVSSEPAADRIEPEPAMHAGPHGTAQPDPEKPEVAQTETPFDAVAIRPDPEDAVFEEWFEQAEVVTIAPPEATPAEPIAQSEDHAGEPPADVAPEDADVEATWADPVEAPAEPLGEAEEAPASPLPETPAPAIQEATGDTVPRGQQIGEEAAPFVPEGRVVSLFGVVQEEEQRELPLAGGEGRAGVADAPFSPDAGHGQIRSIISRIARFRSGEGLAASLGGPVTRFAFETDRAGTVHFVDGGLRGALVGETIARIAEGPFGVDGQAAGAFAKRAPFRDARLVVAGVGEFAGEWRIAGVPAFAPADGRFLGYRCTARRPAGHERAETAAATMPEASAHRGDTLRQIVHELRTPLNAIGGFAEMIRRQMRGPVAGPYRDRARDIADQAGRLMAAVDDLDVAARLEGERLELQHLPVPLGSLLAPVCGEQAEAAKVHGIGFEAALPLDLPAVLGDAAAIRRMVARLLASAAALVGEGEPVRLEGEEADDAVWLRVARPQRLSGVAEAELFDPAWQADGEAADAPLLGLGFSLHLLRRLAAACGGQLLVDESWFRLRLPVAEPLSAVPAGS